MEYLHAVGKRKASIARIYLKNGKGELTINGKSFAEYFPQKYIQANLFEPFNILSIDNTYDILVNVTGGGYKGQAQAIRLAISKALVQINEDYKKTLKGNKLLTRDSRVVERKKYGKPKARKSFQFSKR
jgi:small subunit ribosomal protein S9